MLWGMSMGSLRSRFRGTAVAVAAAALLAGCADGADGGNDASAGDGGTAAENTAQPTGANGGDGGSGDGGAENRPNPTFDDEPDTQGDSDERDEPARSSGSEGRADIPSDPSPVQTVKPQSGGVAVFTTPSGNISCGISSTGLRCGIASYNDNMPYGEARTGGPIDSVSITDGNASMFASSDVPPWSTGAFGAGDTLSPQVVGYGEAVSHGDFVCLSEQTGLTCWDTASGVGAFMSREKTELF